MDPVRDLGRALLILGAGIATVGALIFFGARLPFRLGRLPGDIIHRGEHTTFYFPIVTCLVISVVLSILFWLFSNFRRCIRNRASALTILKFFVPRHLDGFELAFIGSSGIAGKTRKLGNPL